MVGLMIISSSSQRLARSPDARSADPSFLGVNVSCCAAQFPATPIWDSMVRCTAPLMSHDAVFHWCAARFPETPV